MSRRGVASGLLALCLGLSPMVPVQAAGTMGEPLVRLHIVANSNRPQDVAAKLAVRDALWGYLASRMQGARTAQEAILTATRLQPALERIANSTLRGYGVGYNAQVALGTAELPARSYLGVRLPRGRYVTLLVRLGRAGGQNWWCLLFPQLCFSDSAAALDYAEGRAAGPAGFLALGRKSRPAVTSPVRSGGLIWSFWQLFRGQAH